MPGLKAQGRRFDPAPDRLFLKRMLGLLGDGLTRRPADIRLPIYLLPRRGCCFLEPC